MKIRRQTLKLCSHQHEAKTIEIINKCADKSRHLYILLKFLTVFRNCLTFSCTNPVLRWRSVVALTTLLVYFEAGLRGSKSARAFANSRSDWDESRKLRQLIPNLRAFPSDHHHSVDFSYWLFERSGWDKWFFLRKIWLYISSVVIFAARFWFS